MILNKLNGLLFVIPVPLNEPCKERNKKGPLTGPQGRNPALKNEEFHLILPQTIKNFCGVKPTEKSNGTEPLRPQHVDMEFYLYGKNIFGLERPSIEAQYRQKKLEIASERDKDMLEFSICL